MALLQGIYGPLERGESGDFSPFFDALADDVVFQTPVGQLRGKHAVIDYFENAATTMEFRPFERPLEYYGDGDRVVILGEETFRLKASGTTHHTEWAWVYDLDNTLITRIVAIQDLGGVADAIGEAVTKAQAASS